MSEFNALQELGGLTYGGMFILALLSNIFIPVPEELILLATGYFIAKGVFGFGLSSGIFIIGMLVSDCFLYYLARKGVTTMKRFEKRIKSNRYLRDDGFVKNHIRKIIVISRFLVYLRWIGPVLSGSTKVRFKTFLLYDALALCLYVPLFLFLGIYFEGYIDRIAGDINRIRNIFFMIISLIILVVLVKNINKKFIYYITKTIDDYTPSWIPGISIKNPDDEVEDQNIQDKKGEA